MSRAVNKLLKDELTGCFSSGVFTNDFERLIDEAAQDFSDLTLVMLDVDNFKEINDDFGHQAGDKILKEIAEALLKAKVEQKVYRYSGDEFALLLPGTEKERAFLMMEGIRDEICNGEECGQAEVTISAGIATYPDDGIKQTDILRKANGALYRAKSSGKNKVCLAKDEKLITKTAHYTVEQLQKLKELSEDMQIGEAALMREALDELFKKYDTKKQLRRTVLIVEDAEFMRKMLREIMYHNNITVVAEAKDGEEAIGMYNKMNPDFVLLNIVMPKLDGIDFLKAIEKKPKNTIIVLTSQGSKDILIKTIEYGADAFIVVPFTPDYLIDVMNDTETHRLKADSAKIYKQELREVGENDVISQQRIDEIRSKCMQGE